MSTCNAITHAMSCPRCGAFVDALIIDCRFGDTRDLQHLSIGDSYPWLDRKAVQNGGRPEGGNYNGEGYAECPHCNRDFFVKVIIESDVIKRIEPDRHGYKTD